MKYMKKSYEGLDYYFSSNIEEGIILNANESPYNPPKEVIDEYFKRLSSVNFNRYPDMQNLKLCNAIAKHFNVEASNVTCGVGSDELLEVTFKATLEKGDIVLSFSPSFSMYKVFADLEGAIFKEVLLDNENGFPVEEMITKINEYNPKLVLICSPNNPTGAFLEKEAVIKIVEATKGLVILDLAYIDFAKEDYTNLAMQYENVIAYRTFSKAMSLPSIRCGYAISNKENIKMINCVKAPYSLSIPSQIMAEVAISNYDLYKENINAIVEERNRVYNELKKSFYVFDSNANFLYLKLSDEIYNDLLDNKIYIRKMKNDMYRISIGTKEENNKLLKVVNKHAK